MVIDAYTKFLLTGVYELAPCQSRYGAESDKTLWAITGIARHCVEGWHGAAEGGVLQVSPFVHNMGES